MNATLTRYGAAPDQYLHLDVPAGARVVVCLLHGGYWRARHTAELMAPLAAAVPALAGAPSAVANVEYRRDAGVEAMRDDVSAALRVVRQNLPHAPVITVGHSAGGHLALLTSALADAVVALAPVTDLVTGYHEAIGEGAVSELMGGSPAERPALYRSATPAPSGTPTLIVHGADDERVPLAQSHGFVAAARAEGFPVDFFEHASLRHLALIDPVAAHWPAVWGWTGAHV